MPPPPGGGRGRANVQGVDDLGGGPQDWFNALPIVTRLWFGAALLTTVGTNFGLVSPYKLIFLWDNVKDNFEVWRFLTPFLYAGKFDMQTLFALYMLCQFSNRYEAGGPYNTGAGGGTADYAFAMMFAVSTILLSYPIVKGFAPVPPLFVRTLTFFVVYVWSKQNPTAPANIWGFPLKALYLPFAYLALSVLMGGAFYDLLHGIAIGHLYYFLVDVVPIVYGKDFLHTPQFLIDYFGIGEYVPPAPPAAAAGGAAGNNGFRAPGRVNAPGDPTNRGGGGSGGGGARPRGGYNWGGGGRVLGTN